MKKIIALLMAFVLCMGLVGVVSVSADDFTPVLRYAVFSDIHIGMAGDYRCEKVTNAINYAYEVAKADAAYDKLDAVVIVGDIGEEGQDQQWQAAKEVVTSNVNSEETALMVLMGNHEFNTDEETAKERFIDVFEDVNGGGNAEVLDGTMNCANVHYVINGYHFIGFSPDVITPWDHVYSDEKAAWVEEQLKIAEEDTGKDKPIFVFQHIGSLGTVIGTEDDTSNLFREIYNKYPQLVSVSGHSHFPINSETSIWQGEYTAIGTGAFKNAAMPHFDGVKVYLVDKDEYDIDQFYIVEVDAEGRTRITMRDTSEKKQIGETYLIDSYNPADFIYNEKRLEDKPFRFSDDAKLEITDAIAHKVNFTFTPVKQDCLTATAYHVYIDDADGKTVFNQYVGWAFYDESEEDLPVEFGGIIPGLKEGIVYTLTVEGVNSGYTELISEASRVTENKLTTTFHLGELPEESETSEESEISQAEPESKKSASSMIPWIIAIVAGLAAVFIVVIKKKKK